jgi:hypothetical protein
MTAWMGAVKTAISEAYQLNPKPAPFTYQVPPMDISVASTKQNEFRPASPPVAPSKIVMARDASKVVLQPESAAPEEKKRGEEPRGDVSRARVVSGTGTSEDPFILRFPRVVGDDDAIGSATVTLKPVLQFEGADPIYFRVELQQADFADSRFAGISKEASHLLWHQTFGPLQKAGLDARNFQIEITRQITDIFSTEKAKLEKEDRLGRYLGAN